MIDSMKNLILVLCVFVISGCASALKKKCQSTNWFEHGKSVALAGKRLNEDSFVADCAKEDIHANSGEVDLGFKAGMAKYCDVDGVHDLGKRGEFFNADMCDPQIESILKRQHRAGVSIFCESSNGYQVGASGRTYNKICPADREASFLKQFNRGRKVYLTRKIQSAESEILQIDKEVLSLETEKNRLHTELITLPSAQVTVRETVYDPAQKAYREVVRTTENEEVKRRREDLQWRLQGKDSEIQKKREKQLSIRQEIQSFQTERDSLE